MSVREIMHEPTFTAPDENLQNAASLMSEKNISSILVGDESEVRGVVTERDIVRKLADSGDISGVKAEEVMTTNVVSADIDMGIEDVIALMMSHYIRHIPVKDGNRKVVGVLSIRKLMDVIRFQFI